jgi:hypothetical protein
VYSKATTCTVIDHDSNVEARASRRSGEKSPAFFGALVLSSIIAGLIFRSTRKVRVQSGIGAPLSPTLLKITVNTAHGQLARCQRRTSSIWQSAPAVGESLYPSRRRGNPFAEADCVADCDRAAHCALTLRRLQEDDRVPFPCLSRASIAPLQRRAGVTFRESGLWSF